jgi:hypothetical protein
MATTAFAIGDITAHRIVEQEGVSFISWSSSRP